MKNKKDGAGENEDDWDDCDVDSGAEEPAD
jgi:hypothetical protein